MPTFGDTTAGGDTFPTTNDRAIISDFACPESGTAQQINVRFSAASGAGGNAKAFIYADAAGSPGALLVVSAGTAIPGGGGDIAFAIADTAVSAATYWLGCVMDSGDAEWQVDVSGDLKRKEGGGADPNNMSYASPPATWGTDSGTSVAQVNAYVTYITGPTITDQPDPVTRPQGQTATFIVAATGTGSLTYQWQVDDGGGYDNVSDGTGGTTDTYTTAALPLANDGFLYRCQVTDDVATTNTNGARLNVTTAAPIAWYRA